MKQIVEMASGQGNKIRTLKSGSCVRFSSSSLDNGGFFSESSKKEHEFHLAANSSAEDFIFVLLSSAVEECSLHSAVLLVTQLR